MKLFLIQISSIRWLAAMIVHFVWLHPLSAQGNPKAPVVDDYHGTKVSDPYRWLENWFDPAVRRWSGGQTKFARAALDALPARAPTEDRFTRHLLAPSSRYSSLEWRRGQLFLLRSSMPDMHPALVSIGSPTDLSWVKVILDPNQWSTVGAVGIDWYVPSLDGRKVAIALSEDGSEFSKLHLCETMTGQRLQDEVPHAQGSKKGRGVAWNRDASGFFYARSSASSERSDSGAALPLRIYFHKLGSPAERDSFELGIDSPRNATAQFQSSPDGRQVLVTVINGLNGERAHYFRDAQGAWKQVAKFEDRVTQAAFGRDPLGSEFNDDHVLLFLARGESANGRILRVPLDATSLSDAQIIVSEKSKKIRDFVPAATGIFLALEQPGTAEIAFFDYSKKDLTHPKNGADTDTGPGVGDMVATRGDEVLYQSLSYTRPPMWMRFDPGNGKSTSQATALAATSPVSFNDVEVVRESAPSNGGGKILLTMIHRKGTRLDGQAPALLATCDSLVSGSSPESEVARRVWLDQGGVIAIANLRDSPRLGPDSQRPGEGIRSLAADADNLANCARRLVELGYSAPAKLALEGALESGVLVGALLARNPGTVRAVVSRSGLHDLLRAELIPNNFIGKTQFDAGASLEQFQGLLGVSPYHGILHKLNYPAVLLLCGAEDGEVDPAHSRKMAARLQAATTPFRPVLVHASATARRGIGSQLMGRIGDLADVYAFLLDQLGIEYSQIDRGPWSGAVTHSSAIVKARLVREGLSARLAVSVSPSLSRPMYFGYSRSDTNRHSIVEFAAEKLRADTQYYYGMEIEGRLDRRNTGLFRTFPAPGPASFTIAFASCAKTGSILDTFDRIRENRPLFFMHLGDMHYEDIRTDSLALFRDAYDRVLASPQQGDLYRSAPLVYVWDDHDFGGNNSDSRAVSHEAALRAFEEYVPHYPLVLAEKQGAVSQSFSVGRVKFIVTDLRSQRNDPRRRDTSRKSMMGSKQKEWFKQELLSANGQYPLICWVSSDPWLGQPRTNYYHWIRADQYGYIHHTNHLAESIARTNRTTAADDHWSVFASERREIAEFVKANRIRGLCILHGDSHMLAADDGSNGDFAVGGGAPIPVMCAGPLDQTASIKGGYYSEGVYRVRPGEGGFGLLTVTDRFDRIDVSFSGRNNLNEEKISLRFSVPASKRFMDFFKRP